MKAYHFKKQVDENGSVSISELPPGENVDIIVLYPEPSDLSSLMEEWIIEIRGRDPFANMSKDEILTKLRETRDEVWEECYAD
jgi:hypothetical protein